MNNALINKTTRAQESRAAISRLYIAMRHLLLRGSYKPLGASGEAIIKSLLTLKPEIYGSVADPGKVELDGLQYVFQRLPKGIEECRYVKLINREGYENSFEPIEASKRRRQCYRIDAEQMYIEMTRGKSDIYDVLTHLTFMYIEAEKIRNNALDIKGRKKREWLMLEEIVAKIKNKKKFDPEVGCSYLGTLLGRTYDETLEAVEAFDKSSSCNNLFNIVYWLGKYSIDEYLDNVDREISFSSTLREMIGHHTYGAIWAHQIKSYLFDNDMIDRPIHIISSNLHSVMNCFFAKSSLGKKLKDNSILNLAEELSIGKNAKLRQTVKKFAEADGMHTITDASGMNIEVQIFDCASIDLSSLPKELKIKKTKHKKDVIIVMDYAFGEQAYELMDELLKPYELEDERIKLNVLSINVMGKAGILEGDKGDIMIPNAHIFEGTADNYPFNNLFDTTIFEKSQLNVYTGPMITVLGTSLQNRDILRYFHRSSWSCVGLEMEGAHYQKAIQSASHIRQSIDSDVDIRYAYYASDNPLKTGATLSSGGLGITGVEPTYLITLSILNSIFS